MFERSCIASLVMLALTVSLTAGQQRRGTPVNVEFEPPPAGMKSGETATTRLVFRALADIERLEVAIAPVRGVQIVSQQRQAVFTNLRKGDGPVLEVVVRLTDPKFGSLAVTFEAIVNGQSASDVFTIVYGNPEP